MNRRAMLHRLLALAGVPLIPPTDARIEPLRSDEARLGWMIDHGARVEPWPFLKEWWVVAPNDHGEDSIYGRGRDARAAIDSAMDHDPKVTR